MRVNRYDSAEGYVGSESVGQDILIPDRIAMNRALDGDVVAVELLPEVRQLWPLFQQGLPQLHFICPTSSSDARQKAGLT